MDLSSLNAPQREAVMTTDGPLLVLAGAGSGKTRVIIHRLAWLMQKKKVPASAILCVTFTNKAASEMRERAIKLAGPQAKYVTLCTFHAFGAEVMREHAPKLGYPKKFAIADMGDQISIIRRAMKERNVDDRQFDARKVLAIISRHKNARTEPQPKPEEQGDDYDLVAHLVFPLYQLALKAQGAVDFDDLLLLPARLFELKPEVKQKYNDRYRYLMVDEYQDTNAAQLELLVHLAGERKNVCVVGDDDQCIYSWRGAEVRNILDFERHFPGGREVRLEQNYRSSSVILDAANAVIAKNPDRKDKRMWTDQLGGLTIQTVAAPDENEEARWVAFEVKKAVASGLRPGEIAVLYRTNGQSRPVEEALREQQQTYEVIGGQEFFDKREVRDVIAYFKVLANAKDEVSLLRIVNVPARGIGDVTLERLSSHAQINELPLWEVFKAPEQVPDLPRGAAEKVQEFHALMERYRSIYNRGNLAHTTRELLAEIGFADAARAGASSATAADRKVRAIDDLIRSLENFEKREGTRAQLMDYLHRLSLDTREEEEDKVGHGQVTLMTLHSAKGLEWRLVFLIGMEEDLLPHSGMQGEPPNPEEERRLAYVGITRARERLVLTRAAHRVKRGKLLDRTPSRFLGDLPEALVEVIDLVGESVPPAPGQVATFFGGLKEKLKAPPKPGAVAAVAAGSADAGAAVPTIARVGEAGEGAVTEGGGDEVRGANVGSPTAAPSLRRLNLSPAGSDETAPPWDETPRAAPAVVPANLAPFLTAPREERAPASTSAGSSPESPSAPSAPSAAAPSAAAPSAAAPSAAAPSAAAPSAAAPSAAAPSAAAPSAAATGALPAAQPLPKLRTIRFGNKPADN